MQDAYVQSMRGPKPDVRPTFRAFARLTGLYPRGWAAADALPEERSYIFHALVAEQLAPVRIIIGYHGYTDEFALRKGLLEYMHANQMTAGGARRFNSRRDSVAAQNRRPARGRGSPWSSKSCFRRSHLPWTRLLEAGFSKLVGAILGASFTLLAGSSIDS